jgi:hypothetical protein
MLGQRTIWLIVTVSLVATVGLLQTPLFQSTRNMLWGSWVNSVGRAAGIKHMYMTDEILNQLNDLRAENVRLRDELYDYDRLREQLGQPSFSDLESITPMVTGSAVDTLRTNQVLKKRKIVCWYSKNYLCRVLR